MQKIFVVLFNECGRKYKSSPMQLALTGGMIGMLLRNTNMPKGEVKKLLINLPKSLNKAKAFIIVLCFTDLKASLFFSF